jgi:tRNA (guanosine-2'-O-)-methyltransferase
VVSSAADALAFIPQLGKIGSLNVAVAASIALYEARRQGWPPPGSPATASSSSDEPAVGPGPGPD